MQKLREESANAEVEGVVDCQKAVRRPCPQENFCIVPCLDSYKPAAGHCQREGPGTLGWPCIRVFMSMLCTED